MMVVMLGLQVPGGHGQGRHPAGWGGLLQVQMQAHSQLGLALGGRLVCLCLFLFLRVCLSCLRGPG